MQKITAADQAYIVKNGEITALPPGRYQTDDELIATRQYFDSVEEKHKDEVREVLATREKLYTRVKLDELGQYILIKVKMIPQDDEITAANLGRLVYLSTYCDYHNRLMLTERTVMRKSNLPEVLNLSKKQERDFRREMIQAGYLQESNGEFYINDRFLYRGERQERTYNQKMKMFINTVRNIYKSLKPRNHKYFGLIVQLVPYVNRRYNIICRKEDVEEIELEKIHALTITDICRITNYDVNNYNNLLGILVGLLFDVNGYQQSACSLVSYFGNGVSKYRFYFNPRLLFIGDYEDYTILKQHCDFFPQAVKSIRQLKNL